MFLTRCSQCLFTSAKRALSLENVQSTRFISSSSSRYSTTYGFLHVEPDFSKEPEYTMEQVHADFAKTVGFSRSAYTPEGSLQTLKKREELMGLLPQSVDELPPRTMKNSFVSAVIPLETDMGLRERYVTYWGSCRVGRLLEDLDIFAVWCCYNHIKNPKGEGKDSPYSVVTALVDSIFFNQEFIRTDKNIRLSGHVSWVGRSSMEVSIWVDQIRDDGKFKKIFNAVFLMVARDPVNKRAALVNPLVGNTDEEKAYIKMGEERNKIRKTWNLEALAKKPPSEEEREIIHHLFTDSVSAGTLGLTTPKRPVNSVRMKDSVLNTLMLCHPQYRNRYNKIFGGFIMRQAFELAYTNSLMFAKTKPMIANIDDIEFKKPVEIGSILRFKSMIGYVEDNYIHSPVVAEVISPNTGESNITNVFQFTFAIPPEGYEKKGPLREIFPDSYQEAMVYLESRRHFQKMMTERRGFDERVAQHKKTIH